MAISVRLAGRQANDKSCAWSSRIILLDRGNRRLPKCMQNTLRGRSFVGAPPLALPGQRSISLVRVLGVLTFSAAAILLLQVVTASSASPDGASIPSTAQPATPALPTTPATPPQTATVPAADPSSGDEIVCKVSPPKTGSRIGGGRECHTEREWDRRMKESQKILNGSQLRGLEGNPGGH